MQAAAAPSQSAAEQAGPELSMARSRIAGGRELDQETARTSLTSGT
jgi:hypothetical protein